MTDRAAAHRLPLSLCIGWGVGTLGISVMFNSITILMQRFATDFLGVAAATWGFIYLGSKIYDAVTDPLMGYVSDNTRSRWGRRRPYLLIGAVISIVAFLALFNAPDTSQSSSTVLFLFLALLLYSTGYTIFNVPYIAMLAEMTSDYKERARLVSFRVYGIGLGTIIGLGCAPLLVDYFGAGRSGHEKMALTFAIVIFLALSACFLMTKQASQTDSSSDRSLPWRESIALVWQNKPFVKILCLKFTQLSSVAINQTLLVYFVIHVLQKDYQFLGIYGLIAATATMIGPVLALRSMHRFDKRQIYVAAAVVHSLLMLSWIFSGPQEATSLLIVRGALLGLTAGIMIMMGQAMLPDAISFESLTEGVHREGVYSGLYTTAEKLAFASGGALSAFILGAYGYVSSTTGGAVQPQEAISAIYFCVGILPAVLAAFSCVFLIGYDLDEARLTALRERHSVAV